MFNVSNENKSNIWLSEKKKKSHSLYNINLRIIYQDPKIKFNFFQYSNRVSSHIFQGKKK